MKPITLAAALILAATAAHAQGWDPGRAGGAPLPYNAPWSAPSSTYTPLYTPSLPQVPAVQSYVPAPSQGPSSYPCTMPGCR